MVRVLGVHDGHTATAALLEDGVVKACISEERLNREKEWYGFPRASIHEVLKLANTCSEEVDLVTIAYRIKPISVEQFAGRKSSIKTLGFSIFKSILPAQLLKKKLVGITGG